MTLRAVSCGPHGFERGWEFGGMLVTLPLPLNPGPALREPHSLDLALEEPCGPGLAWRAAEFGTSSVGHFL